MTNTETNELKKRPFSPKWIILVLVFLVIALAGGTFIVRNQETRKVATGREAITNGQWSDAVAALDGAIALQPAFLKQRNDEAAALRGFAQYKLGNNDEAALSDFSTALDKNGRFYDLPAYQADIFLRQGKYEEAVNSADTALEHADDLPLYLQAQLHGQKGLALMELGEETAVSSIDTALTLINHLPDPLLSQLLSARAHTAIANGEIEDGLAYIARAEALSIPIDGTLLIEKTAVLHQQGDREAALAASKRALETNQLTNEDSAELHLLRADIASQQGNLDEAITEADAASALVDGLAQPDALRAWQQYRQFEWDAAVETANAALEMDENNALAYRVRGAVAHWRGQYDDALADLNHALELEPNDVEALALRTVLHYALSNSDAGDADTFCQWRGARLPSEAEWEMAASYDPARGVKVRYPWGDVFDGTNLNFCDRNCPLDGQDLSVDDGHLDTAPVGSYANGRSPIGAYDMAGNVTEWVSDWYGRNYYAESGELSPLGPLEGTDKVLRGGAWLSEAEDTTVFARDSRETAVARAQIGFRCAMAVP